MEGHTGLLHAPADAADLAAKLERILADPGFRSWLGENARLRAIAEFAEEKLTGELRRFYRGLM